MSFDTLKLRLPSRGLPLTVAWPAVTGRRAAAAAYVLLMAMALTPVHLVDILPVAGFTNHMARVHVLANLADDPLLQQAYRTDWALKPNLAIDLLLPPLTAVIPVFEAGRLFVALSMLMLVGGVVALHRVLHGRVGLWPAAAFLFLYNQTLTMGFLNFQFGLGLALIGAAGWIATRQRPALIRIASFTVLSTALFFTHLMALAIYGVVIGGYELSRAFHGGFRWRNALRGWAAGAAQFVLPAILLLVALPPAPAHPSYDYGGVLVKVFAMLSPMLAYHDATNPYLILLVATVALFGIATRRFAVAPHTGLVLLLLAGAGLVAPFTMYGRFGGVWGVDLRLFVAFAFVATAVLDFRAGSMRVAAVICAAAFAVFAARIWVVGTAWIVYDRQFAEYRQAARVIESGSTVMQAQNWFGPVAGDPQGFPYTYWYLATLSVIDRSVFLPTFYSDPLKQPVVATKRYEEIDTPGGTPVPIDRLRALADPAVFDWFRDDKGTVGERLYGYMWQDAFDYVVTVHSGDGGGNPAPELMTPVAHGSFFDIYRTRPGTCTADYPSTCRSLQRNGDVRQ